ncbi:MAG: oligoendopeptidase F, partial [Pseudomonadota bacterium]
MAKLAIVPHDAAERARAATRLGALPEWDLSDFYTGPDDAALAADLEALAEAARAFEADYKGQLAQRLGAADGGNALAGALKRYEALEDKLGRLGSYAGLLYTTDTTNPAYAKTYGDVSDKLTRLSSHLLFFPLELNRIDEPLMEAALAEPAAAHYRPFIDDLRKERPYQLSDELEQLFLDKTTSSRNGWSRLFDDTIAAIRVDLGGSEPVTLEEALNKLLDTDPDARKAASDGIAKALKANERTFTLITNTLAKDKEISDRWRG